MKSSWKKFLFYSSIVIVLGGVIFGLIPLGYSYSWTGFGEYIPSSPDAVRGKTLWDWMELLIVPFVLAGGAYFLNRSERELERKTTEDRANLEREIAKDRQQEAALQTYFDRMSELLLKEKLRTTKRAEVRDVARTRTISILRVLDTRRNNLVFQFLREAQLITDEKSLFNGSNMSELDLKNVIANMVYLQRANLFKVNFQSTVLTDANLQGAILTSANLQNVWLWDANLQGAHIFNSNLRNAALAEANLQGAVLYNVNLMGANLTNANLRRTTLMKSNLQNVKLEGANLQRAILTDASLQGVDMQNANLQGAILENADLKDAKNLTEEQLAKVKSLKGAIMPDGTKHD